LANRTREREEEKGYHPMRGHSVILIISNTDGSDDDHHDQLITSRGKKISQEKRKERGREKKKKGSFAHIHLDKRPRGHVLVCDATNRQTIEIDW
jgi:hypothetical protein